ncbi:MAG TPA: tRNA (N(6)-L-threonylcarbamoyladenosine(37)-C(2))-methylthiotransferase MtaB [Bacteroidia bacterium]|nr:tRNA (N(6)-L-threonylcarbamoyladenosine(37)-C(2))-methylthiotransferase MtaB [Bacteroidia bacterium]
MFFPSRSVAFHTLGCKLNFSETSSIARLFLEKGYTKKDFSEAADVYVINTCSVTENADRECKSIVRAALSRNPEAFIAVVGCYAQLKPNEIASIEGVDVVLGASEKFKLLNYISFSKKAARAEVHNCEITEANFFVDAYSLGDRTRSFLKVQDGCDYSCTFCTIPLARGSSRSDSIENVLRNARKIADSGVKEIVLTGVNIGDFGYGGQVGTELRKGRAETFLELIRQLDQVEGVERYRISSIEPNLLHKEIIAFVSQSKRFVPHFHIPLQSGSNAILKLMKRRYQRELYAEKIQHIKSLMPDCCIGVDVIVGFPGESEDHFMETYAFLQSLDISYLHVFTYSERENTEAASMKGSVPLSERKRRNKMLRILSAKKLHAFYKSQLGREQEVLFENENKDGYMFGYTRNYIKVKSKYQGSHTNKPQVLILRDMDEQGHALGEVSIQDMQLDPELL